jgi:hypothetical protein
MKFENIFEIDDLFLCVSGKEIEINFWVEEGTYITIGNAKKQNERIIFDMDTSICLDDKIAEALSGTQFSTMIKIIDSL